MNHYETIILGGGPGGYCAALSLAKKGKQAAIIEKNKLGGTCLHEGCIPTKSLLNCAKHISGSLNFSEISEKKRNDILKLYKGLSAQIKNAGIPIIHGTGKLLLQDGKTAIEADGEIYTFDDLIIATGSRNKSMGIEGLDKAVASGKAVYSDGFLNLNTIPEKILIIGGGVIGIEFASFIAMLGKKVVIIESQKQILNNILDEDTRNIYIKELEKAGIRIITSARIEEIDSGNVVYEINGEYDEYEADLIVLSCGRIPNTENIGLEKAGIKTDRGFISVDSHCKTNIDNIYACGDVTGSYMLAHAAYKEAEIAVENICGEDSVISYNAMPSAVYSNPELAVVGVNESYCINHNIPYYIKKASMLYSSRYMIEFGECSGICKLIFKDTGELIGAQLVGNNSSEIIFSLADMISMKQTESDIKKKIFPHPSFIEIIKEVIK